MAKIKIDESNRLSNRKWEEEEQTYSPRITSEIKLKLSSIEEKTPVKKNIGSTTTYVAGKVATGAASIYEGIADAGAWGLIQAGKMTNWIVDNPAGKFIFGKEAGDLDSNILYQIGSQMREDEVTNVLDEKIDTSKTAKRSYIQPNTIGAGVASGVGQVAAMIATGNMLGLSGKTSTLPASATKAQKILDSAKIAISNPSTKVMFASTFGNSYTQAANEGADDLSATVYGLLNAVKESATEMMYGGLGTAFGKGALDDVAKEGIEKLVYSKLGETVKAKILSKIAQLGVGMFAEGLEEVVASILDPFVQYVYTHNLDFSGYDSVMDDFIVGALVSGIMQTPGTIVDLKNKNAEQISQSLQENNVKIKLDKINSDTTKIINDTTIKGDDKVNRINNEIDMLNDILTTDVKVGTLDIESIYNQKQELIKQREEIAKTLNEEQKIEIVKTLSTQITEIFNAETENITPAVTEVVDDKVQQVEKMTKEVEKDKKIKVLSNKQKIQLNSEQYINEASGIINNINMNIPEGQKRVEIVTELNQEQRQIMDLGAVFGKQIIFTDNMPQSGLVSQNNPNILFIDNKATSQLVTNKQATNLYVLGHELFHSLKQVNPETYNQFTDYVKQNVTVEQIVDFAQKYDPQNANELLNSIKIDGEFKLDEIKKHYLKYKNQNAALDYIIEEMTANEFGGMITDSNYMNKLYESNKSLFDKVVDAIRELFKSLTGSAYDSSLTQLQVEKIRNDFESIIKETKEKAAKTEQKTASKEIEYRYHNTSPDAIENIGKKGLLPNEGQYGKGVYFAPTVKDTENWYGDKGAVLRVDKNKLDSYDEFKGEQGWNDNIVPSNLLEVSYDKGKTWKPLKENETKTDKINETVFNTDDKYIYHLDYTNSPYESFAKYGIKPSKKGIAGPGVYMGNTEENTEYNAEIDEGTMYRIDKQKLIDKFGLYNTNTNKEGLLQFDDSTGEILLGGNNNVPADMIQVRQNGKWIDLIQKNETKKPATTKIQENESLTADETLARNRWVGADSYKINDELRRGNKLTDNLKTTSDEMSKLLKKYDDYKGTLYRSMTLDGDKLTKFIAENQPGEYVTNKSFVSASNEVYDDTMNVQMTIQSKHAKDVSKLMRRNENEFLFDKGMKYKVLSADFSDTNNITLEVQEVDKIPSKPVEVKEEVKPGTQGMKTTQMDMGVWFDNINKMYDKYVETKDSDRLAAVTNAYENYKKKGGTEVISELDSVVETKAKADFKAKLKEAGLKIKELPKTMPLSMRRKILNREIIIPEGMSLGEAINEYKKDPTNKRFSAKTINPVSYAKDVMPADIGSVLELNRVEQLNIKNTDKRTIKNMFGKGLYFSLNEKTTQYYEYNYKDAHTLVDKYDVDTKNIFVLPLDQIYDNNGQYLKGRNRYDIDATTELSKEMIKQGLLTEKENNKIMNSSNSDIIEEYNNILKEKGYKGIAIFVHPTDMKNNEVTFFGGSQLLLFDKSKATLKESTGTYGPDYNIKNIKYLPKSEGKQPVFYSQLEKTIEQKMPNSADVQTILNIINSGQVKQDEIKWSGIKDYLNTKDKFTKQEIIDFLKMNNLEIKEVTKSGGPIEYSAKDKQKLLELFDEQKQIEYKLYQIFIDAGGTESHFMNIVLISDGRTDRIRNRVNAFLLDKKLDNHEIFVLEDVIEKNRRDIERIVFDYQRNNTTKYDAYKVKGGKNYQELLFTLPQTINMQYRSSHWNEMNVLAHTRFDDRTTKDGSKVLFLEEIQSDWHQEGRKKGYTLNEELRRKQINGLPVGYTVRRLTRSESREFEDAKYMVFDANGETHSSGDTREEAISNAIHNGFDDDGRGFTTSTSKKIIPEAPFEKTWHEFVLKRMLRYAAENGYDYLSWANGGQNAQHYALEKQISELRYSHLTLQAYDLKGNLVFEKEAPDELSDEEFLTEYIGKDAANKLLQQPAGEFGELVLEGADLKMGGEGMKGFYDKIIPAFLNKYVKKWGSGVENISIEENTEGEDNVGLPITRLNSLNQQAVKITDNMKKSVLEEGQAKYLPKSKNLIEQQKESQFYSNTAVNSPVFKSIIDSLSKNKDFRYYSTVSHKTDFNKAVERIQQRGDAAITDFMATKSFDSVDSAMAKILIEYYQKLGDVQSETNVAIKVREAITQGAQVVESAKIFKNMSPASMLLQVETDLNRAYESLQDSGDPIIRAWLNENANGVVFTEAERDWLYQNFAKLNKLDANSREYAVKHALIQSFVANKIPKNIAQKAKAFRRIAMLFNPKTMGRNVLGNVVVIPAHRSADRFGSYLDSFLAKQTGVRTTGGRNVQASKEGRRRGLKYAKQDFQLGINTDVSNAFEKQVGNTWKDSDLKGAGKVLNYMEKWMNYGLDIGDRPFYEAYYENSIANQMRLNNVTEPTQSMIEIAQAEAAKKTWKNNGKMVQLASTVRRIGNMVGFKNGKLSYDSQGNVDLGVGDIILPFIMTPANLAVAIYDYSPAAFTSVYKNARAFNNAVKSGKNVEFTQKALVDSFGRASTGVVLFAIAYVLAKAGLISGGEDEDKDVRALMKAQGYQPYSIKIGDTTFSYDWAQPIANPFAIMAELNRQTEINKNNPNKSDEANNMFKAVSEAFTLGADRLYEQSFLQSLKNIFSAETPQEAVINFTGDLPASFVPTLFKQIADTIDGNAKATYDKNNLLTSMFARAAVKIPVLKSTLPTKKDVLGNNIELYGGENNIFNTALFPFNVSKDKAGDVGKELSDVYNHTGEKAIMPQVAVRYIDYDTNGDGIKERITFNNVQQSTLQEIMGKLNADTVYEMLNNSVYQNASYEDKATALTSLVQYAKAVALRDSGLVPNYEIKSGNAAQIDKYTNQGLSISDAVMYDSLINPIKSLKNNSGETIQGSANGQKAYTIMNMQISDSSKNIMLQLISPTSKNPETVSSLSKLSTVQQYIDYYSLSRTDYTLINKYSRDDYDISTQYFNIDGALYTKFANEVSEIRADVDAKGNVIANSKKNKVFEYINSLPLSQYQKLYLFAVSGYSIKGYSNQMFNYINSLDISAEEKLQIWTSLGLK